MGLPGFKYPPCNIIFYNNFLKEKNYFFFNHTAPPPLRLVELSRVERGSLLLDNNDDDDGLKRDGHTTPRPHTGESPEEGDAYLLMQLSWASLLVLEDSPLSPDDSPPRRRNTFFNSNRGDLMLAGDGSCNLDSAVDDRLASSPMTTKVGIRS
jgi:hypothetical protein